MKSKCMSLREISKFDVSFLHGCEISGLVRNIKNDHVSQIGIGIVSVC